MGNASGQHASVCGFPFVHTGAVCVNDRGILYFGHLQNDA